MLYSCAICPIFMDYRARTPAYARTRGEVRGCVPLVASLTLEWRIDRLTAASRPPFGTAGGYEGGYGPHRGHMGRASTSVRPDRVSFW